MVELLEALAQDIKLKTDQRIYYCLTQGEGLKLEDLTPGELVDYQHHEHPPTYLQGRAALKKLCRTLSLSEDTSKIRFPASQFSLTHAQSFAIAMYCEPSSYFDGFGIDLESVHPLNENHARFFIHEQEDLGGVDLTSENLIKLWTIKEAVFKSDFEGQSRELKDYRLCLSDQTARKDSKRFVFESRQHKNWHFSLAFRLT